MNHKYGIFCANNTKSNIKINHNSINATALQNYYSRGIYVIGNNHKFEKYSIHNNNISNPSFGITALSIYKPYISQNNINNLKNSIGGLPSLNMLGKGGLTRGILAQNCFSPGIVDNVVTSISIPEDVTSIGIHIESSPKSYIKCNQLTELGASIRASNACVESRIIANSMSVSLEGLSLSHNGYIGPQGSTTEPSNNAWLPSAQSWYDQDRWPHFTHSSLGHNSPLYVRNGAISNPIENPLAYNDFGNAFKIISGDFTMNPTICNSSTDITVILNVIEINSLINDLIYFSAYDEEIKEWIVHELVRIIPEDSLALLEGDVLAYIQYMENQPMGLLNQVQDLTDEELYAQAKALNLSINTITQIESTERFVRDIQLEFLESNTISELDIIKLDSIASLCPYTFGYGVYMARSIMLYLDPMLYYITECELDEDFEVRRANVLKKNYNFKIYPNPVNETLYFSVNEVEIDETATIEISDVNGRIITSKKMLLNDINSINVSNLSNGCYLLKIIFDSKNQKTEKFCVVK